MSIATGPNMRSHRRFAAGADRPPSLAVVVDRRGDILTADHVVAGARDRRHAPGAPRARSGRCAARRATAGLRPGERTAATVIRHGKCLSLAITLARQTARVAERLRPPGGASRDSPTPAAAGRD